MKLLKRILLAVFGIACLSGAVFAADDLLIADFEDGSYGGWSVEGNAFGNKPVDRETATRWGSRGFKGDGLVDTHVNKDWKPQGSLTSPDFVIQRDYINLLIGGGFNRKTVGVRVLVDGEEAGRVTALKSNHLDEVSIPVSEHRGKKAVIEIFDRDSGWWGYIKVDDIRQSDVKVGFEPVVKELKVTKNLLLFPVAKSGVTRRISITVDGMLIHHPLACLAMNEQEVAWWGYLDMSDMVGKTAKIALAQRIGGSVVDMIECADEPRCILPKYDEKFRPQFHFSQLQGWNNDPNGMVYSEGRYHLFWQCNPLGTSWGNMYWGHASSPDMVNWTEHKRALRAGAGRGLPLDRRHPSMATGACFSGSGNVDHNNATGLNIGDKKTLLLFNSDMNAGVSAFFSHDGINFKRWMQKYPLGITGRDAKFVFHEPTHKWVAVSCLANKEHGRHFPIFTSTDLKNWNLEQTFKDVHECPEFFELPVDGDLNNKKWVLVEASGEYFVGEFNGRKFTPASNKKQVTMIPRACYAGQCFSNSPDSRVVYIGWAGLVTQDMPFNQGFTIPMNLTLKTVKDGTVHLFANPVKEVETLRKTAEFADETIELDSGTPTFRKALSGELYDVCLTLKKKGSPKTATITVGKFRLTYDFATEHFGKMAAPLTDGKLNVRILVDRPTIEVFMADGYSYHLETRKARSGEMPGEITISTDAPVGSSVIVESLKVYPMISIWKERR